MDSRRCTQLELRHVQPDPAIPDGTAEEGRDGQRPLGTFRPLNLGGEASARHDARDRFPPVYSTEANNFCANLPAIVFSTLVVPVSAPSVWRYAVDVVRQEAGDRQGLAVPHPPVRGPRALRTAYERTLANAALAVHARLRGPLIDPEELVMPRVFGLLDTAEQEAVLRPLQPILALPPNHRDMYVQTLDVLHRTSRLTEAAAMLHLHVNSVRRRIDRIGELTGVNMEGRRDQRQALDIAALLYWFLSTGTAAPAGGAQ